MTKSDDQRIGKYRIIGNFVDDVIADLEEVYRKETDLARANWNSLPDLVATTGRMKVAIEQKARKISEDGVKY